MGKTFLMYVFMDYLKKELNMTKILLRNIPSSVVALFTVSVVGMNLLANKTIVDLPYLALDGGILMSWLSFMSMDVITIHYGPKAANRVAVFAMFINLLASLIFFIAAIIPSSAADYTAFNTIFKGTWFILLGSSIAFILSAYVNNFLNWTIGKLFKDSSTKTAYMARTYISTLIGQFIDNLVFALIVFKIFAPIFWDGFSWTLIQCLSCALTGALLELLMEVIFSPWGYNIAKSWKKDDVGKEYLKMLKEEER